jgi:hypothetical protein
MRTLNKLKFTKKKCLSCDPPLVSLGVKPKYVGNTREGFFLES